MHNIYILTIVNAISGRGRGYFKLNVASSCKEENMQAFDINKERRKVHQDELSYVEEAFATLPSEEREFIKRYIAEA